MVTYRCMKYADVQKWSQSHSEFKDKVNIHDWISTHTILKLPLNIYNQQCQNEQNHSTFIKKQCTKHFFHLLHVHFSSHNTLLKPFLIVVVHFCSVLNQPVKETNKTMILNLRHNCKLSHQCLARLYLIINTIVSRAFQTKWPLVPWS